MAVVLVLTPKKLDKDGLINSSPFFFCEFYPGDASPWKVIGADAGAYIVNPVLTGLWESTPYVLTAHVCEYLPSLYESEHSSGPLKLVASVEHVDGRTIWSRHLLKSATTGIQLASVITGLKPCNIPGRASAARTPAPP